LILYFSTRTFFKGQNLRPEILFSYPFLLKNFFEFLPERAKFLGILPRSSIY